MIAAIPFWIVYAALCFALDLPLWIFVVIAIYIPVQLFISSLFAIANAKDY